MPRRCDGLQQARALAEGGGLLDATITVGQAFGGDHEAVNVYSGLLAAKAAFGADVAIVGQGPGNVGTETEWGFGSIAQGDHINAAGVLGGLPIRVPRISFADPDRAPRVSSQTLVVLGQVALVRAAVSVPAMAEERLALVHQQLDDAGVTARHDVLVVDGGTGLEVLDERGIEARSMGRTPTEDPEFFWPRARRARWRRRRLMDDALRERLLSLPDCVRGRLLTLRVDEVELPNGRKATRETVLHPGLW